MELKITIEYTFPNNSKSKFDIYSIASNASEVLLIGFDHRHNQFSVLGIKESEVGENNEFMHVYHIYQIKNQNKYKQILESSIGSNISLPSEILNGSWSDKNFTIQDMSPNIIGKLKYFEKYILVQKIPGNNFMKHSHGMNHKKVNLKPYQL